MAAHGKNKKKRKAKFKLHKIQSGIISYYTWLNLYFVGLVLLDFVRQFLRSFLECGASVSQQAVGSTITIWRSDFGNASG